jgi:hypothetical protein
MITKNLSLIKFLVLCGLVLACCKTPYDPPLKSTETNVLVVEGNIDGAAPIVVKLSRTRMVTAGDTAGRKYELQARVSVEDDHQNSYSLTEAGNGIYTSISTVNLNPSYQYRLHIFTFDNREYQSTFVPFKSSPPIDSINWGIKDNGVQVYINTHDPQNATKYYRWTYNETWEFHSEYTSDFYYDAATNTVLPRTIEVNQCWQSDSSSSIYLGSSTQLASDLIYESPLPYFQLHDEKLSVLYSILVTQYALDVNGYNFWVAMKSNTENVGSIFDPQPNEMMGNIHCITNPSESVVGYVNAGNSVQKRFYISNSSLPPGWNIYAYCPLLMVPADSLHYYFTGGYDPISRTQTGYVAASEGCVDCTLSGTNIKPPFWP